MTPSSPRNWTLPRFCFSLGKGEVVGSIPPSQHHFIYAIQNIVTKPVPSRPLLPVVKQCRVLALPPPSKDHPPKPCRSGEPWESFAGRGKLRATRRQWQGPNSWRRAVSERLLTIPFEFNPRRRPASTRRARLFRRRSRAARRGRPLPAQALARASVNPYIVVKNHSLPKMRISCAIHRPRLFDSATTCRRIS